MALHKVFVEGYGCAHNQSDTESIKGLLTANGFELVDMESAAEWFVVNTCAVKDQTEFKILRRLEELNARIASNGGGLIVMGCLPSVSGAKIQRTAPLAVQLPPRLEALADHLNVESHAFDLLGERVPFNPLIAIVPIETGCLDYCTFCATKRARGDLKSHSVETIVRAVERRVHAGAREVWLTGEDTGCYGVDIGTSLPLLVRAILGLKLDFRLRIGMMNPHHLKGIALDLFSLYKDSRVYKFLHVPLQAGSNRVLSAMKRRYTVEEWLNLVTLARKRVPGIRISTDVIAGFPSETSEEFLETLRALETARPEVVNISRYGRRPKTLAALMPSQVPGWMKKDRSRALSRLCRRMSLDAHQALVGQTLDVHVNESGKGGTVIGRTLSYVPVALDQGTTGSRVKVCITHAFAHYVKAKRITPFPSNAFQPLPAVTPFKILAQGSHF
ncbi:MAG: tRNA (N(6)-L-threonylcarbamoyladenosine(37)-C(2))-methylthiotransferase [Candidatus Diapherotrites archaeon]|nr:tRNA (N(6)-L-threonylcarbamoyladenosine(37)-C(2))-methylthiotransferase [Candidatus Diapherotrites archaeon]